MIYMSKNEDVCCEVQTHFLNSSLVRFIKKVLGAFSRFMRPKTKLFSNSDAFQKFSACMFYRKCSRRIITIYASKNKAVCLEVQTHFGTSLCLQGLQKKFWAHFHNLCIQKWSCFLQSLDAYRTFLPCEVYKKFSGLNVTIYASKNEAVCLEVQTHFVVLSLQVLQKKFWAHFCDLCVQKRSCLP